MTVGAERDGERRREEPAGRAVFFAEGHGGNPTGREKNPEVTKVFDQDIIKAAMEGDLGNIYRFILGLSVKSRPANMRGR